MTKSKPRIRKRAIEIGGMLACCLATVLAFDGEETEGTTVFCDGCKEHIVIHNGHWTYAGKPR